MASRILPQEFYEDDPATVAVKLLGSILVRRIGEMRLSCMIVETEAYYGPEDPASRARKGGDLRRVMMGDAGVALVYGVHKNWLLNIVAHKKGEAGAVLIRACEPLEGVELMCKLRGLRGKSLTSLTSGPGRLTKALAIDKSFHEKPVYTMEHGLWVEEGIRVVPEKIGRSHRIGVSADLPIPLRFYILGNKFVSRK